MNKSKVSEKYLIANLNYLNSENKIWLNPSYQREAVWTRSQKQLLIDSILRDIDIPKFYFREIHNAEQYEYEVVDGQQRLRSIFEFMANGFKLSADSDDIGEHAISGQTFKQLATSIQMKFQNAQLDVVVYNSAYTDTDIEETFLRMQNGTPLNAAEKRRAIAGNMRTVVAELSKHKIFKLCVFDDSRFAYEDSVAKALHQLLAGSITDIRPASLSRTYKSYKGIKSDNKELKRLRSAYNFIVKAFKSSPSPGLKKYSIITLAFLVVEMLDVYDLSKHADEFAKVYLDFDTRRIKNENLAEEDQDSSLAAYSDAARSDSIQDMRYRHDMLVSEFVTNIPTLTLKDPNRSFTHEQRMAIYRLSGGKCQERGCSAVCEESDFHADHKVPHSRGGRTTVENGQVLCPSHNLKKGDRM
jgi:5-methylcytosine-specific restriction endonuclease McrA